MPLIDLTIKQAATALAAGETTSRALCEAFLARAEAVEPRVKAFLSLDREDVLRQADEADRRRASGAARGPYDGIPLAVKDNINVTGQPCSCGSKILAPYRATYDATVTRKLREAGFIFFGRTNQDEFAMGSSTENSAYGPSANPWNLECVPAAPAAAARRRSRRARRPRRSAPTPAAPSASRPASAASSG